MTACVACGQEPGTLDVEALARALRPRHLFGHPSWNCDDGIDERYAQEMAETIAAEYARLSSSDTEEVGS